MRAYAFSVLFVTVAALAYVGARVAIRASDERAYRGPVGAGSLDGAVQMGTLAGIYACDDASLAGAPYAERLFVRRLGPFLQRRVHYADRFAIQVPVEGFTAADTLAFGDGSAATCCTAERRDVPEAFWLVRGGERVCRFEIDPATQSDGLPEGARVTEP